MIIIPTRTWGQLLPPTNAQRRASWAYRYELQRDSEAARIDMARTRMLKLDQMRKRRGLR